jgi:hypothetical protein
MCVRAGLRGAASPMPVADIGLRLVDARGFDMVSLCREIKVLEFLGFAAFALREFSPATAVAETNYGQQS